MTSAEPVTRGAIVLKSRQFRVERETTWRELEKLLDQIAAAGVGALTIEQRERFPQLYRSALSSLSVARAIALDRAMVEYLNNLCLRAFLAVYAPPRNIKREFATFCTQQIPAAVRSLRWHVGIMIVLLALSSFSGYHLVHRNEGWFEELVPVDLANGRGPLSTAIELRTILTAPLPGFTRTLAMVANALFTHNTTVGLLMFGLGFLAGVPTVMIWLQQGFVLGAFFALHSARGLTTEFAGWVFIHGVTELGALILFGAAGLRLGELLVFPGNHSRVDNFAIQAPIAGAVAVCGGAMLVIAAVLEGVLRQAIVSTDIRLTVAIASLAFWLLYFALAGRNHKENGIAIPRR